MASYDASYSGGDVIGDSNRVTSDTPATGSHRGAQQGATALSNPAHGYADITEHRAVRINDDGEFIHQNRDAVDAQRVHTVSHACINMSAQDADAYFETAFCDDPVEVNRHQRASVAADGDLYGCGPSPAISHRVRG